jgi:hypothetical protein
MYQFPTRVPLRTANLKKATLEIDLSSITVRDDAKIDRRTVGVTGILRLDVSLPTEDEGETYDFGDAPVDLAGGLFVVEDILAVAGKRSGGL